MTPAPTTQPSQQQRDPAVSGDWARAGAWLFERRTWLPLPLALALLLIPSSGGAEEKSGLALSLGVLIVALGESLRLWGVHHIGAISRTRSDRLGPLVSTGPFAYIRNPLYLGNIALWIGFAIAADLLWMAPIIIVILGFEYHAIVRWEETLLEARRGDEYRAYVERVPRWLPTGTAGAASASSSSRGAFSWRETFFSERGTLIAIAVGFVLIYVKLTL